MNTSTLETTIQLMTASASKQTSATPHVRFIELSKSLGNLNAVDRVSLDIPRGQITTLLGPSGCGKSTTLRLLAGLYQPSSGDITLDGESIVHLPPNKRRMTMVFQEYALFPHLTVADNVGYGLRMRRTPANQAKARIGEMLELVGLSAAAGKHPHQLSGGQQQRVALARALAVDPEVLLLDEPLSNLDAKLRVRLREEIVRLQKVLGKTMVFVTHDQEEAMSISHQIAVMGSGRISQVGAPEDIYARPASRYVAEFVGLANFLDAKVIERGLVKVGDVSISVQTGDITGKATLMVRPEAISIVEHTSQVDVPMLRGRLVDRTFLGSMARYSVETSQGLVIVDDHALTSRELVGEVTLALAPDRLHLLPAH
ncbi:iron(III) transport system ATP-binding protein/putative spermidine/putrescine transport system ATP-binding protein [Paraburkholderia sp. BL6665CI2N2]|uniref:ABC transporter ATP-binding protein n=1 Tax=Paraburkholderia sp. BL6665CI2N2 TaxID=1938806 RepID=UPI00106678FC|nr:ABC transporter ATP-binding protein [Paraburkholderia sp. BL6665CI2N2]TDY16826.1 iron(III) transport system ATP-binding protein/putative spermidine/putrescine transport system ATP-binding protein [Paraburkholderia sp. BL6665CI2N2]